VLTLHEQIALRDHDDDRVLRRLLRDRLRDLDALAVLNDLDLGRIHEQKRNERREDVDQRNEVQLGIRPVPQVVLRHAPGAIGRGHGYFT
jgi:hypothetical protein